MDTPTDNQQTLQTKEGSPPPAKQMLQALTSTITML